MKITTGTQTTTSISSDYYSAKETKLRDDLEPGKITFATGIKYSIINLLYPYTIINILRKNNL